MAFNSELMLRRTWSCLAPSAAIWGLFVLLSLGQLSDVSAVATGGDVLNEGCEEFVHAENASGMERYEIIAVNYREVATPLTVGIWILIAAFAKVLFHFSPLPKYLPESCLLIAIGFVIGGIFLKTHSTVFTAELSTDLFFLYLLPPIMMEAGYFMPQAAFWSNIGSILTFAVIGTLINAFTIGLSLWGISESGILGANVSISFLECMTFSSLISAVDPVAVLAVFEEVHVNQVLHILVFGESLLNDAVTVVLYRVFEAFNEIGAEHLAGLDIFLGILSFFVVAFGGILVGLIFGFITAFISKYTYKVRVIEPIFVFVMAYLSYLIAEMLTLSSILSIVACSMFMKPYVEQNISRKSHTTIKYFLKMLSSMSETIIFIFLGTTSLEEKGMHQWNTWFVIFTLIFCFVYRSIGVILQVKVLNYFRLFKINRRSQFIMAYGGIRGAIAFSLVALLCVQVIPSKPIFFTATVVVIMFTVFIQGMTIKPLVDLLHVQRAEKRKPTMNEEIYHSFTPHLMAGIEDIIGHHGHNFFREKWEYYNEHYLERALVRERKESRNQKIIDVYRNLAQKDAIELIKEYKPVPSSASLAGLASRPSESSLMTAPATLEVPADTSLRQRHPGAGEGTEGQPALMEEEGEPPVQLRKRSGSFSRHVDAFKRHAFKPQRTFTVRQSRYIIDDEETEERPPAHLGRSLHILARHKTRKARPARGGRKVSNQASPGFLGKPKKNKSVASVSEENGGASVNSKGRSKFKKASVISAPIPQIKIIRPSNEDDAEDEGIVFSAKPAKTPTRGEAEPADVHITAPPSDIDPEVTPEVKFSIEDEEVKGEGETQF